MDRYILPTNCKLTPGMALRVSSISTLEEDLQEGSPSKLSLFPSRNACVNAPPGEHLLVLLLTKLPSVPSVPTTALLPIAIDALIKLGWGPLDVMAKMQKYILQLQEVLQDHGIDIPGESSTLQEDDP